MVGRDIEVVDSKNRQRHAKLCANCDRLTSNIKGVCGKCMSRSEVNNYGTFNGQPIKCPPVKQ